MTFLERLSELLREYKCSNNKMLTDLKLGKNSVINWEQRGTIPGGETLAKIADYFDVSTDYLLGKTNVKKPHEAEGNAVFLNNKAVYSIPVSVYKIRLLCKERGIKQKYLCEKIGVKESYFADVVRHNRDIPNERLSIIAKLLNTTPEYLRDEANVKKPPEAEGNAVFLNNKAVYSIPVFESVSAGFGSQADNVIQDYTPLFFDSEYEAKETICIRVTGDSMYPKIEQGDIIQVHKQTSVDSGSVAVLLLDGEEGLVKKVMYGRDWIELHSFNPMYPPRRFENSEVLRLQVVGLVKKVIKEI